MEEISIKDEKPVKEQGVVYVRVDKELKQSAEAILEELGLTPSAAVQMFYKQIVRDGALPLNLSIRKPRRPIDMDMLSDEEIVNLLRMAEADIKGQKYYTLDEAKEILGIK